MSTTTTTTTVSLVTSFDGVMATVIIGVVILIAGLIIRELCSYHRPTREPLAVKFRVLGVNVLVAVVPMLLVFGLVIWYKTYWALH